MKKPTTAVRIISIVLCIVLALSMMAGIIIASIRIATTKENTAKIIRQALFTTHALRPGKPSAGTGGAAAPVRRPLQLSPARLDNQENGVMTQVLVDWLFENLEAQYGSELPVTREAVEAFIAESTLKDEISDLAASLISDFITGENTAVLDEATLRQLISENAELIQTHFGVTLSDSDIDGLVTTIATNDYVAQLQHDGIGSLLLDSAGNQSGSSADIGQSDTTVGEGSGQIVPTSPAAELLNTFRTATSVGVMIACFAVAALCIAGLCLLNRARLWYALRKIGIGLLAGSLPALIPTALAALLAGVWNSLFASLSFVGTVVGMILKITAPVCISFFVAGVILIVVAGVLKGQAKKKSALAATTEELSSALADMEETPAEPETEAEEEAESV